MQHVVLLNKPLGLTPLQAIYSLKKHYPEYAESKIGFAGRLDPMAEGLLLLLVDEENKRRKAYEALPKTYEFSMLLGVSTDTYDLMGMITAISNQPIAMSKNAVEELLPSFLGPQTLPYPPYSSRTVNGIPLYKYARENQLNTITIPTKQVTISSFHLLSSSLLPTSELLLYISRIIPKVQGDFRQEEIVKTWHESSPLFPASFPKFDFRIICSSGTYVRGIVHELGEKLGIPTITHSIKRTSIGDYSLTDAFSFDEPYV